MNGRYQIIFLLCYYICIIRIIIFKNLSIPDHPALATECDIMYLYDTLILCTYIMYLNYVPINAWHCYAYVWSDSVYIRPTQEGLFPMEYECFFNFFLLFYFI